MSDIVESAESSDPMQVALRRYSNRRYYDTTRSQHLTLEDIYHLVRDGYNVTVSDSKSGEDITARILAHLILEHDPPKLAAFPAELLHQIIRSNESLLREFVEKYFNRALTAFLKSQQEFDRYLGQAMGLYGLPSMSRGWAEMMMGPFVRTFLAGEEDAGAARPSTAPGQGAAGDDLRKTVEDLRQQVAALRNQLDRG
jgi:polyhydroxyalkanoate synthesis repressor PhaR